MTFAKVDPQPEPRDGALAYEELGPGLYPDEVLVRLDTGELVAVSAHSQRMPTGGGVIVTGWARWADKTGKTRLDPAGQEVELETRHTFDAGFVAAFGVEALSRQIMLAMLGEPLEETGEGDERRPIVGLSEETLRNMSIRDAIRLARVTGTMDAELIFATPGG